MEQKIQELTEKIYKEGVEKGASEARAIIADAQSKAATIIAEAKKQAGQLISDAQNQVTELQKTTEAEIRLAGTQALTLIKQQILEAITAKIIDSSTTALMSSPANIKEFVVLAIQNWKIENGTLSLDVLLPEQKQQELTAAFMQSASDMLKNGLTLSFSKHIKAGFRIGPQNGSFKISCTDEDFAEFFKDFLRPKTRTWLFGE